jgi:hypothetical protein
MHGQGAVANARMICRSKIMHGQGALANARMICRRKRLKNRAKIE